MKRWRGLCLGIIATAVACILWATGLLDPLDRVSRNLHFGMFSSIEADPFITLIDIDDFALEHVHRWPWPRRLHADLVRTCDELGAHLIVLDIAFSEPSTPRVVRPDLGPHWDIDSDIAIVGDSAEPTVIYDDVELEQAIAQAGNVYLAMVLNMQLPNSRANSTAELFDEALTLKLEQDFSASIADHSDEQHQKPDDRRLRLAREEAANRLATRFLDEKPSGTWPEFFRFAMPQASIDHLTPKREALLVAYRNRLAISAMLDAYGAIDESDASGLPKANSASPPIARLLEASKGAGFVTYMRDPYDGVVRDAPLVAELEGKLVASLGLLAACACAEISPKSIAIEDSAIVIEGDRTDWRIPLDSAGATPIHWHVPKPSRDWLESFTHVPAARVLEIALNRRAIEDNATRVNILWAELVEERFREAGAGFEDYEAIIRRHNTMKPEPSDYGLSRVMIAPDSRAEVHSESIEWLKYQKKLWEGAVPQTDEERIEQERIDRLYRVYIEDNAIEQLRLYNSKLRERCDSLIDELSPAIRGKACFVGYTATSVADLVPTPYNASLPGVMAHANIFNMCRQANFARHAPKWVVAAIIILGGIVVSVAASVRGPVIGSASLPATAFIIVAVSAGVFSTTGVHIESLSACAAICLPWAVSATHRQLTEERTKRRIRRSLAQYTSPAIAAQIAGNIEEQRFAAQAAEVTCFFCDLKGFTPLSERLGAERTKEVLNEYLQRVSATLVAHGALVNKFIGDGVFAFYNAPIRPCRNHAKLACESALACLKAIGEVNASHSPEESESLVMRIGISTGTAFVGDYGSAAKLDYTCIGDTVNLGSRLEGANKIIGSVVLTDRDTREQVGEELIFRPVGKFRVAGRTRPVEAFELLDTETLGSDEAEKCAEMFDQFTTALYARRTQECRKLLHPMRQACPYDPVLSLLERMISYCEDLASDDEWDGSISLEELSGS